MVQQTGLGCSSCASAGLSKCAWSRFRACRGVAWLPSFAFHHCIYKALIRRQHLLQHAASRNHGLAVATGCQHNAIIDGAVVPSLPPQ